MVAAILHDAVIAPMVLDGPMDSLAFEAYIEQVLIPALPPGSIVVMDNLSSHKPTFVEKLLNEAGFELWYLPPYSPDFNPIENMWSKIKAFLRSAKARTQEKLYDAIAAALELVTPKDTRGFFYHSVVGIIS